MQHAAQPYKSGMIEVRALMQGTWAMRWRRWWRAG